MRYLKLPRIVGYIGIGLLLGPGGFGLIPRLPAAEWRLVVDLALGILLFELGSKVNLRWLKANPWIAATSLLEADCDFCRGIFASGMVWISSVTAAVVATIMIVTSPAIVVRIVTESRAQGQVTDRLLLMTALNCIYAVIFHKLAVAAMHGATGTSFIHTRLPAALPHRRFGAAGLAVRHDFRANPSLPRAPRGNVLLHPVRHDRVRDDHGFDTQAQPHPGIAGRRPDNPIPPPAAPYISAALRLSRGRSGRADVHCKRPGRGPRWIARQFPAGIAACRCAQ